MFIIIIIILTEVAFRRCSSNGTWLGKVAEDYDHGWTNYTGCYTSSAHQLLMKLFNSSEEEGKVSVFECFKCLIIDIFPLQLGPTPLTWNSNYARKYFNPLSIFTKSLKTIWIGIRIVRSNPNPILSHGRSEPLSKSNRIKTHTNL